MASLLGTSSLPHESTLVTSSLPHCGCRLLEYSPTIVPRMSVHSRRHDTPFAQPAQRPYPVVPLTSGPSTSFGPRDEDSGTQLRSSITTPDPNSDSHLAYFASGTLDAADFVTSRALSRSIIST